MSAPRAVYVTLGTRLDSLGFCFGFALGRAPAPEAPSRGPSWIAVNKIFKLHSAMNGIVISASHAHTPSHVAKGPDH